MQVGAYLVASAEAFELMKPGERSLYDSPGFAQAGTVQGTTAGDLRRYPSLPEEAPVLVEVVAAVGIQALRTVARPSAQATNARDGIDQRHELGDIAPVAPGR